MLRAGESRSPHLPRFCFSPRAWVHWRRARALGLDAPALDAYLAISEATTNGAVERLDALASLDLKTAGLRMGYADLLLHAGRRDEGLAQLRQALAMAARGRPSPAQLQAIRERIAAAEAAASGVRP